MLENIYEGLNAQQCIWRLKFSTQSVFIERVFLRNVHTRLACLLSFASLLLLYVAGGYNEGFLNIGILLSCNRLLDKPGQWTPLALPVIGTLTIVNGQMVVAGGIAGEPMLASVETFNGSEWIQNNNLKVCFHTALPDRDVSVIYVQHFKGPDRFLMRPWKRD